MDLGNVPDLRGIYCVFSRVFSSANMCERLGLAEGCDACEGLVCILMSLGKSDIKTLKAPQ